MVYAAAKTVKFLLFMAMLLFGATSIPRLIFLLFLFATGGEMPMTVVKEVITGFIYFVIATVGFIGISSWLRKREDVYS
jgi:hypothetical protein